MSLVPAFVIGFWNAWIMCIVLYAVVFVPLSIYSDIVEKRMEGEPKGSEQKKSTKIVNFITHLLIMPFTLIYSIFLPLQLGTWWFYTGLLIYLIGLLIVLMVSISFSSEPVDQPLSKGIYAISRHPQYLGFFLAYTGIGIACASWVFLLCALIWIVAWQFGIDEEERILLEKYGDSYLEYMNRTPRWIGITNVS